MAFPEPFFTIFPQVIATLSGLLITLTAVLYQLESSRKRNKAAELRSLLIEFDQKYSDSLRRVMEILEESFDKEVPATISNPEELRQLGRLITTMSRKS
jgi:hypothetical protein